VLTNQTFTATTTASSVQFLEPINLPPSLLISLDAEAIQIGENSIFVDSTQFPFLDVPARIVFENLGGSARIVLVDFEDNGTFVPCDPPQCTLVSFVDGTLIFDVTGFTTYSSEEVNENPTLESVVLAVLAEIDALLINPGVNDKAKKKLNKSKKKLAKALRELEKGNVKKALKEIGKAVKKLLKAEKEGADTADLIDLLVESSRAEAQDAIDVAIAAGGKLEDIDKAQAEMVKAQNELDKGKPDKAIDRYKRAWEKAQKAVK
jgi:tetratricopeptide (TPR) repeat protein